MPHFVEYLADEQLTVGLVTEQDARRLVVTDAKGRPSKLAPDKVLFSHQAASLDELRARLEELQREIDPALLWEMLLTEGDLTPHETDELAELYFGGASAARSSAIYRALSGERLRFRRRGKSFEARSADEVEQLTRQREASTRALAEVQQLSEALVPGRVDAALCERLERYLRLGGDKPLAAALAQLNEQPQQLAFDLLLGAGHLPPSADLEVLQANLSPSHPEAAMRYATALELPAIEAQPCRAAFSIDDPDTREVDDALSVERVGELVRVDIDIADVASLVRAGDPLDQEAHKRAVTIYLATGVYLMLPERISCDLLSLHAGQRRPTLRTSVWLTANGCIERYQLERTWAVVEERLDYETADRLLQTGDQLLQTGEGGTAHALRLLQQAADGLAARRRAAGALSVRQREWKIHVSPDASEITVKEIPAQSPSRSLVAEMMILANGLAARYAEEHRLPIIYRVQAPPSEVPPPIEPGDPTALYKLRHLLQPAALSLRSAKHWGLGLEAYTQASSPLRRYTDLVIQRQLHAGLAGEAPPYSADELLRVLATAEATEREVKRLEATIEARWALEYVARLPRRQQLSAVVLQPMAGGYRVELSCCGAQGLLVDSQPHELGEVLLVDVKTVKPRRGLLRMVPS